MDSDSHQQLGYGLLRFRSAPSSLLGSFAESGPGKLSPAGSAGFEAEKFAPRFLGFSGGGGGTLFEEKLNKESPAASPRGGYTGLPPQYPRPSSEASYGAAGSLGMDFQAQPKLNGSSLARQTSSPPGLFSAQNGHAAVKATGSYRVGGGFNGDVSPTNKWKGQFSFPSSLGMLSQISEIESESMGEGGLNDSSRLSIGIGESRYSGSGLFSSWSDSSHLSDNFASLKRERENDVKLFHGTQNSELGNRGPLLSHHLSLPRSSSGVVSAMDKLLHFQDSVPCKIRAKRGCATHPRSIAERVRRTRISERMRKLQELVPNMDKQTNTADMLDLAVEYIKDMQKQFKTLSDNRANCKCSNPHKSVTNQIM